MKRKNVNLNNNISTDEKKEKKQDNKLAALILLLRPYLKYILATIAIIVAVIAVLFGESKYMLEDTVSANVKFNKLYYTNVETGEKFVTLKEAVDKSTADNPTGKNTIRVLNGREETDAVTVPADKEIELDLNGKTVEFNIDAQSEVTSAITNNGTLTITDATEATEATDEYSYTFKDETKLQIGGTLKSNKAAVTNNGTATIEGTANIHGTGNDTYTIVNDGTFTVENGTIRSTNYRAIANGESNPTSANITINDGTLIAANQGIRNLGNINQVTGQTVTAQAVKITGGRFETQSNTIVNADASTGLIYITGGDITGGLSELDTPTIYNGKDGKIIIDENNPGDTLITDYSDNAAVYNGYAAGATGTTEIRKGKIIGINGRGVINGSDNVGTNPILIIGTNEATPSVSTTVPSITGKTVGVQITHGTFNFYDGRITGETGKSVSKEPNDTPTGYGVLKTQKATTEEATLSPRAVFDFNEANNVNMWTFKKEDRFTALNYNSSTGMNTITVNGNSGWEQIYIPIKTVANQKYTFSLDYNIPSAYTTHSTTYEGLGIQAIASIPSGNDNLTTAITTTYLPKTAGSGTHQMEFTATGTTTYLLLNFGMLTDGVSTTINLGNFRIAKPLAANTALGDLPDLSLASGYKFAGWNGKNLFNKNAIQIAGKTYIKGDGTNVENNEYSLYQTNIEPSTTYTITNSGGSTAPGYAIYDASGSYLRGENYANRSTVTFTTPANAAYIKFSVVTLSTSNRYDKDTFQLEKGSAATSYEDYFISATTTTSTDVRIYKGIVGPGAPTISAKLNNASGAAYTGENYTNQNVYVIISPTTIGEAGIREFQWYENGAWTTRAIGIVDGTGRLTYTVNRNENIRYRVVDNNGLISDESTFNVKIDKTAPTIKVTTYKYDSTKANNAGDLAVAEKTYTSDGTLTVSNDWVNYGGSFKFETIDSNSGITSGSWKWDTLYGATDPGSNYGGGPTNYTDAGTNGIRYLGLSGNGWRKAQYKMQDAAGNSTTVTVVIKVDTTKPTITSATASTTTDIASYVDFNATDAGSQIKYYNITTSNTAPSTWIPVVSTVETATETKYENNAAWARVFHHNSHWGNVLYSNANSYAEAKSSNTVDKYSVLGSLANYKNSSNWEFMLQYPDLSVTQYNRWTQTVNPATTTVANGTGSETAGGYTAVHIDWNGNYWGGLTLSTAAACFINGSVGHVNWFYAIGAKEAWNGAIPGPNSTGISTVNLWSRIDNLTNTTSANLTRRLGDLKSNTTYYVWVKDAAGNTASKAVTVSNVDTTAPTVSITSTNNVAESQTATLSLEDNKALDKYYWGTSDPANKNVTYVATSGTSQSITKTVSDGGTYYLAVIDKAGNRTITSKVFYKTTLTPNRGSVNPTSVITMSGNKFTIPTPGAVTGYTWGGWFKESGLTNSAGTTWTPTANATLYGKWTINKYYLTYDYQDSYTYSGSNAMDTGYKYNWDKNFKIESKFKVTATGKRYAVFSSYNDTTKNLALEITTDNKLRIFMGNSALDDKSSTAIPINTDITATFQWNASTKKYTLTATGTGVNISMTNTLSSMNGSGTKNVLVGRDERTTTFSSINVTMFKISTEYDYNTTISTLPTVSKTGYTYSGWYDAASGGNKVTSVTIPAANKTIYAQWTANKYKITLNNQLANTTGTTAAWYYYKTTKTVNNVTAYYYSDEACTTPLTNGHTITIPVKSGYTFGGYYTAVNGGGTQYVNASGTFVNSIYSNVADNTTLYAKWTEKTYTATLYESEGADPMTGTVPYSDISFLNYAVNLRMMNNSIGYGTYTYKELTPLTSDPIFNTGQNNVTVYDNNHTGKVTITRTVSNGRGILTITNAGGTATSPGLGGFVQSSGTVSANKKYVHIFSANLPSGYYFQQANNNMGTGATITWLTSNAGTGNNQVYAYQVNTGSAAGSTAFGNFGHVYVSTSPVRSTAAATGTYTMTLEYSNIFDITSNDAGIGMIDGSAVLTGKMTRDISNTIFTLSPTEYIYDGTAKTPTPTVTDNCNDENLTLTKNTEYTIAYSNNTNVGTATATITGKNVFSTPTYTYYIGTKSATFYINNAKLTFNVSSNSGTISGTSPQYIRKGQTGVYTGIRNSTAGTIPTATRTGYTFTGWWTAASGGTKVINADNSIVASVSGWTDANKKWLRTADSTLYAQFTVNKYTITYNANNFSATNKTQNGLTFTYDQATSILTINGTWTATSAGFNTMSGLTFASGDKYNITLTYQSGSYTTTVNPVFVFDFQNDGANYNTEVRKGGTHYRTLTYPTTGTATANLSIGSSTLDANGLNFWMWQSTANGTTFTDYKVKVNVTKETTASIAYGSKYSGFPANPTRVGSTFKGWYTAESGGTQVTTSTNMTSTSAHTIYAQWTTNTATLYYYPNGGSAMANRPLQTSGTYSGASATTSTITYGSGNANIFNCTTLFSRTGYHTLSDAQAWRKDSATSTTYINQASQNFDSYIKSSSTVIKLYANWTPTVYTITLNNQSATTAGTTTIYEKYNTGYYTNSAATTQMTTSANGITVPKKTGYVFMGYYTETSDGTQYIDANGKLTSSASATNFTANGTLYAQWDRAVFATGPIVNGKIKQATGSGSTYGATDTVMTKFMKYTGSSPVSTTYNVSSSSIPIYVWCTNGIVYWWSQDSSPYLNAESNLLFSQFESVTSIDFSGISTANVTDMSNMFSGCENLTTLNISSFNTAKVTDMSNMFSGCENLTTLNISSFNTAKVTNMSGMFDGCKKLTTLNLSNFNTAKVTDMSYMFVNCTSLSSLNISSFNTANVTNMGTMFRFCESLTTLSVSNFNTSKVTTMFNMFSRCSKLTTLDLTNFNTSSVENMNQMFYSCSKLTTIYASTNFKTTNATSSTDMFNSCSVLKGGAGTTFNSSYVDKTMAKIDGGTSNPGYFTAKTANSSTTSTGSAPKLLASGKSLLSVNNNINTANEPALNKDNTNSDEQVTSDVGTKNYLDTKGTSNDNEDDQTANSTKQDEITIVQIENIVVAQIADTPFPTISEAIQAANSGDTIKLLQDQSLEETIEIPKNKNITIDLNGKTLTSSNISTITNNGTLTITSTSNGLLKNESLNGVVNINKCDLTVDNAIIITSENGGKAIENDSGTVTVKSGKIVTEGIGSIGIYNENEGTVVAEKGIIEARKSGSKAIYNDANIKLEKAQIIVAADDTTGIYNSKNSKSCEIDGTEITVEADEIENYELIKNTDEFKAELEQMKPSYGIYNESKEEVQIKTATIKVERLKGVGIINNSEGTITLGVDESKEGKEIDLNTASPIIYATADNTTALINSKEGKINFYDGKILSTSTIKNVITGILNNYEINEEFNSNNISAILKLIDEDAFGDTFQKSS